VWENLPAHNFVVRGVEPGEPEPTSALDRNPDLWLYRRRTAALLRRYMKLSLEAGRLPSVIGREFFRAKVTAYKGTTFEERVIFVRDVESCLERLSRFDQGIIARLVLQEHDHERAARLLNCARKTLERRLPELLDELSEVFLSVGLLVALPEGGKK
jgi:DNA-directed RNA polymerase specialized sigma24 family protein